MPLPTSTPPDEFHDKLLAARYEGKPLTLKSWTVMIKDAKGSKDGWF